MKKISQTHLIKAPVSEVWKALTDPKYINKWGAGPCRMSEEEGFEFSLWDGEIFGKNIKVVPQKKLVQEWFAGRWDKPSLATFTLKSNGDETTVKLDQVDVPDAEFEDVADGWKKFYLIPMKELLEQ